MVLLAGMGLASVVAVCEFIWKSRKLATEEHVSVLMGVPVRRDDVLQVHPMSNEILRFYAVFPVGSTSQCVFASFS